MKLTMNKIEAIRLLKEGKIDFFILKTDPLINWCKWTLAENGILWCEDFGELESNVPYESILETSNIFEDELHFEAGYTYHVQLELF